MADSSAAASSAAPPKSSNTSSNGPEVDRSFYNWTTLFSLMMGTAAPGVEQKYRQTRDIINEKADCERCERHKKWLFQYSPIVRFMQHNIDLLSNGNDDARIHEGNVRCRRCEHKQGGAFDPEYGILVCANHMRNRGHLEDTMAHEMVHAYDHMRFKLDPYDLRHAACMEIRASTLSGECRWTREFFTRNQWSVTQQFQECVRRRAALSVAARPACKDDVQAARMVNEVWDSCFRDTRPFDEVYR